MTNALQMQPTFRVELPMVLSEAKQRLKAAIRTEELAGKAESAGDVLDYRVDAEEKRFWSPHLSIQLQSGGSDDTEVYGRFSPRPEIWTMVMAIYMVATCFLFGSLIYGVVQMMMKDSPWGFVVAPASILVIAGLHTASLIGQSWSRDQMVVLRERWDRTVELAMEDSVAPEELAAASSGT